jgi:hypothetical protein
MTRKDYEAVAIAISKYCDETESAMRLDTVEDIVEILAEIFATDNPRFNTDKFRQACR